MNYRKTKFNRPIHSLSDAIILILSYLLDQYVTKKSYLIIKLFNDMLVKHARNNTATCDERRINKSFESQSICVARDYLHNADR